MGVSLALAINTKTLVNMHLKEFWGWCICKNRNLYFLHMHQLSSHCFTIYTNIFPLHLVENNKRPASVVASSKTRFQPALIMSNYFVVREIRDIWLSRMGEKTSAKRKYWKELWCNFASWCGGCVSFHIQYLMHIGRKIKSIYDNWRLLCQMVEKII